MTQSKKPNGWKTTVDVSEYSKTMYNELKEEYGMSSFGDFIDYIFEEFQNMKTKRPAGRKEVEIPQGELEELVMYMTRQEMATHYGVSMQTINNKMKKYGIDKKSLLEKKKNALLKGMKN